VAEQRTVSPSRQENEHLKKLNILLSDTAPAGRPGQSLIDSKLLRLGTVCVHAFETTHPNR
jgi:hypothetical protein